MTRIEQNQTCNGNRKASRQRGQQRLQAHLEGEIGMHRTWGNAHERWGPKPIDQSDRCHAAGAAFLHCGWPVFPHGRSSDGREGPAKIDG